MKTQIRPKEKRRAEIINFAFYKKYKQILIEDF